MLHRTNPVMIPGSESNKPVRENKKFSLEEVGSPLRYGLQDYFFSNRLDNEEKTNSVNANPNTGNSHSMKV